MFDQKTIHPALNLDSLLDQISLVASSEDFDKIRKALNDAEKDWEENKCKMSIGSYDDITLGSILIVSSSEKKELHAVVVGPSKYRNGFRGWFLNDKIEDITLPQIIRHETDEPYVPLQLKCVDGKKYRPPLLKAAEDLRQKYNEEYQMIKGE